jgi:hypothetical protein
MRETERKGGKWGVIGERTFVTEGEIIQKIICCVSR